jgi:hypothetical protein
MPFTPHDDALSLAISDSMQEDARPFLIIRDRQYRIPKNIDVDGCIPFKEAKAWLGWLDPDTLRQLHTAGHVVLCPATPVAPHFGDTVDKARRRQVCISSFLLAAAQARADNFPDEHLDAQASRHWSRIANSVFPLDAQTFNLYNDDIPKYLRMSVIENILNYPAIYHHHRLSIDFMSGRLRAAAISAVEAVTREYGNADAPLQDFLPRKNGPRFRTILLRAFHANHNAAWHVTSLEPISAALRVVIAVGRLARDRTGPLTSGLVRDMRLLRDPWPQTVSDDAGREDVEKLYSAIESFVKDIIGADECASLAAQKPAPIPDHVWTPPRRFLPLLPELKFGWLQG